MKDIVRNAFTDVFGDRTDVRLYFAPGRVNLIGEHTDYNGGHVFPCALSLGTYAAAAKRDDDKLRFYSVNLPETGIAESRTGYLRPLEDSGWTAYPKGVMWAFACAGMKMDSGLDIVIGGDVPTGAGLSSSASLGVVTGIMLRDMFGFDADNIEIAVLARKAENEYCGLSCGIMDQFASAMGRTNSAIFLDTSDLSFRYMPLELKDEVLIITNTNVKHSLTESAYNDRQRECAEALADLRRVIEADSLCGIGTETFEKYRSSINDPVCRRRAGHAVHEERRTIDAMHALEKGDLACFGRLMNASHISLRDDYEVSCRELDILAETAWTVPGVLGSRMTGGGFGGCTVSIVRRESADMFRCVVGETYREKTGIDCTFYTVTPGGGADVL